MWFVCVEIGWKSWGSAGHDTGSAERAGEVQPLFPNLHIIPVAAGSGRNR